ncbi:MAG: methylated-DNA--[protein]-cysteine S-methyltransferase [Bacteroidetes bacterium]|nr:methylated-DNA--[protein]-cysteine S-methyltransferase [Fibrella sp.]
METALLTTQAQLDYDRVEAAIRYINANATRQPNLKDIADSVHLSEFHFERLFSRWAGTTPQRFLRYLTKEHAKQLLDQSRDLLDVTYQTGLSSPGRLHDLLVTYEALTPGEYKQKGAGLDVVFGIHPTPFGDCLIGMTSRGICRLNFLQADTRDQTISEFRAAWSGANLTENEAITAPVIDRIFAETPSNKPLPLLLKGTNFQIKVWEALLQIPTGSVVSYETVARQIGSPNAIRAVGTACGQNGIGYLIPCHRVIQKVGGLGGYRWGLPRKQALLGREAARAGL